MVVDEVSLFKALDCETRFEVLRRLYGGPMSAKEIAANLSVGVFAVLHHLEILEAAGLVKKADVNRATSRSGIPYRLSDAPALLTFPRRQYDLLADQLLSGFLVALGREPVRKALRDIGREIGAREAGRSDPQRKTRETFAEFKAKYILGIIREGVGDSKIVLDLPQTLVYRVYNCPWSELAHKYPDLLCDALEDGREEALEESSGGTLVCRKSAGIPAGRGFCEFEVDAIDL